MRVLLDTTYARRAPLSGTAIYLERLQGALGELTGVEVLPVANLRRGVAAGGGLGSVRNLLADTLWVQLGLPRAARRRRAPLIHHPLPAASNVPGVAQVVTVHDLAFERLPGRFDPRYRAYARLAHRAAARRARAVICVSHTTARDVRELWGVAQGRIVVAPLGPGQALEAASAGAPAHRPEHFLYVGDAEPRKDLPVLLEAYRRYRGRAAEPLGLVLAGSATAAGEGILAVSGPDRSRLAGLYAAAAALVQPSLYEGFGLPALEAMSLGTPVLAARAPGTSEVCGEAALYVAPGDAEGLAQEMVRLAADGELRARLSLRGRERAAQFSWAECARRHLEAYSLALGA